jgi:uncharacterized membrane protein (UPF0127 family)
VPKGAVVVRSSQNNTLPPLGVSARIASRLAIGGSLCLAAAGCEATSRRPEPPPPAPPAAETGVESARPALAETPPTAAAQHADPAPTPPRCVVPMPSEPARAALPAEHCPPEPEPGPILKRGQVRFREAPGQPTVSVERALDDATRARGLMYRTQMDGDAGMLFSWPSDGVRSFWMQNTCLPLDMLFIAGDGTIVGILEQVPTLNTLPRGVRCESRHVLELNAGWVRAHGVEPGQRVDIQG